MKRRSGDGALILLTLMVMAVDGNPASERPVPGPGVFVPLGPAEPIVWEVEDIAAVSEHLRQSKGTRFSPIITDSRRNAWIAFIAFYQYYEEKKDSYFYVGLKLEAINGNATAIVVNGVRIHFLYPDRESFEIPVEEVSSLSVGDLVKSKGRWNLPSQFGSIRFQFNIVYKPPVVDDKAKPNHHDGQLDKTFDDRQLPDCLLKSKSGKKFGCHEVVLVAYSKVLEAIIRDEKKSGMCLIEINDGEDAGILAMINFIYKGEKPKSTKVESFENIFHLADKYQLNGLKEHCQALIRSDLCVANAADTLAFAHRYALHDLRDATADLIFAKSEEVIFTDGWKRLQFEHPALYSMMTDAFNRHGKYAYRVRKTEL